MTSMQKDSRRQRCFAVFKPAEHLLIEMQFELGVHLLKGLIQHGKNLLCVLPADGRAGQRRTAQAAPQSIGSMI